MMFYSDDKQDEFVYNLSKGKRDGFYLDIGSSSYNGSNNTFFFESLNWKGVCIEKNPVFNEGYKNRTCRYINEDALLVDYEKIFYENTFPNSIDYLSLDVDEASTEVLKILPLDKYRFKIITLEHDAHYYGDIYKNAQREILWSKGYYLLCSEVLNQSGRNIGQEHGYEDWWYDAIHFDAEVWQKIYSHRLDASQIIQKFK